MTDDQNSAMKIVMLGSSAVGKTSIVLQLQEKVFKTLVTPTVGSGVISKDIQTPNGVIPLKIWDTAGEERYRSFTGLYCQDAVGGILVFDLTDPESFASLDEWYTLFTNNGDKNFVLLLAGNKSDLVDQRKVDFETINTYADSHNLKYYEVSAKTGQNIELLFKDLAIALTPRIAESSLTPKEIDNHDSGCC